MTTSIKRRRGTTAQTSVFTGAVGETTVDTTKQTVVVHDGLTAGGFPLATETNLALKANKASPTFTGTVSGITATMVGAPSGSGASSGTNTGDQTNISGNAATVTTNANLTGAVTSVGNATTLSNAVVTTAKLSTDLQASTFGFKNVLINGNFSINQRGVSGTVVLSAGVYGHDRFKAGSAGCTYTFATSANVTTITISAGSLIQVVEGVNLQSGTYVLSWTGTVQGKIAGGSYAAAGLTGTATGGTNLNVEFNTGTLSFVQLEKGSTATSFDYRDYGRELIMCQRYLPCINASSASASAFCNGYTYSASAGQVFYTFQVVPRTPPTGISSTAVSGFQVEVPGLSSSAPTGISFSSSSLQGCALLITSTSAFGVGGAVLKTNSSSAQLQFIGCEL
jgi:hypothetical protein